MGIRPKIFLAFLLCFGALAAAGLGLLHRSVQQSYEVLEKRQMISEVLRVQRAYEADQSGLQRQLGDWANWTDMYDFAFSPASHQTWAKSNLSELALVPADLSMVLVVDTQGMLLARTLRTRSGNVLKLPSLESSAYFSVLKESPKTARCGLMWLDGVLLQVCWSAIHRSDYSGNPVGNLVMGRVIDDAQMERLRTLVDQDFTLRPALTPPANARTWADVLPKSNVGARTVYAAKADDEYTMYYPLHDLAQTPVALIGMTVPREVMRQGEHFYEEVRLQLIWVALAMALALALAVHYLLVHRLRSFTRQLTSLAKQSSWNARVAIRGDDELGVLRTKVNALLDMIEAQVLALKELSLTDALTQLPNRRAFDERLAHEFSLAQRNGRSLVLLIIDVDHFKLYNDHYGHPAGDQALKAVAQVLSESVTRLPDMAARIGGEEFAILIPEIDVKGALVVAQRVRANLAQRAIPHVASQATGMLTVSIGVALATNESRETFTGRADRALYDAKKNGRDCAWCAD